MDLHRLRVVEFDTVVSEKEDEKRNTAEPEKHTPDDCKAVSYDDIKCETNEPKSDKKCPGDNASLIESSTKSSFIKHKSKSEIFRIPSKTKLRKREHKNNSSVVDLTKPFQDSIHSNQKKRTLNLFNRKCREDQNGDHTTKKKDECNTNEKVNFLFARETPSFIRYSRKRARNEETKKKHDSYLTNDIFGFQKNKRSIDPYLYQMSCNYLNIDKLPFKKIRKGLRRKRGGLPPQSVQDCCCKHHAMRILNSGIASSGGAAECPSMYYTLSTHSQPRRTRRKRSYSRYEEIFKGDRSFYKAKDQTVAVSPSSLVSVTKCCCDKCIGPSKVELTSRSQRRSPGAHRDASPAHQKPPGPRRHKPYPQHSTPSPSCTTNAPVQSKTHVVPCKKNKNNNKKIGSLITKQRNKLFSGFFQKVTACHISKNRPSGKNCIKYAFFGLLIVVWAPCLLAVILAWIVMCPVRITHLLAADKTKRSFPIMNSFMNRFRKKGPGSEYQRMSFEKYPCQKNRNFMTSVASWYARAAGTVANSFNAMISLLKLKNKSPTGAGSSFLTPNHPNPKKRYTLFYADNRGWMMKPARRSNTRSCASTRVVQSLRCEFKPQFWQKPKRDEVKLGSSRRIMSYECPVHGPVRCCTNTRQQLSPAGDASPMVTNAVPGCVCGDALLSYSGYRDSPFELNKARNKIAGSAMFMPTHRLPRQQVNIPPILFHPKSGIAPNTTDYQTVTPKSNNIKSIQIVDTPQKDFDNYYPCQRKDGTLPYGVAFDYPCGTKHPLMTNKEVCRTHKFSVAGKTLKMSTKYTPSMKLNGLQGLSTKSGIKHEPKKTHKKSLNTHKIGLTDLTKTKPLQFTASSKSNSLRGQSTECQIAFNCPWGKKHKSSNQKTQREKLRTRNKKVLVDISQSALTNQVGTSTHKINLVDKAQSTKRNISQKGDVLANKTQNIQKQNNKYDIALNCPCGTKHQSSEFTNKNKPTQTNKHDAAELHSYKQATITDIALNCLCGAKPETSGFACKTEKVPSKTKIDSKETLPNKKAITISSTKYDIALNCPCGAKQQPSELTNGNTPTSNNAKKQSLLNKKSITNYKYGIALNCPCGAKPETSDCGCETEKQPSTANKESLCTQTNTSAECLPKKQESVLQKQSVTEDKASKCACKDEPNITKETARPEKSVSCKKAAECRCWNEKQTRTIAVKPPTKEQASQCACKDDPSTIKETVPVKQSGSYKTATDCSCWNEKLKSTSAAKPPAKEQAAQCPCKEEPCLGTKKVPLKQSMTQEKAIDCSCRNEKQTNTTTAKPISKEQASQCACEEEPSATKESAPLKQPSSFRKAIDCGCGTEINMVKALNCPCGGTTHNNSKIDKEPKKVVECGCGPALSASKTIYPPKQQKLNTAHKETMPLKQSRSFNTATDCRCWNEKLKSTSAANRPAKVQASQCACEEELSATTETASLKQSVSFRKAIDCGCGTESKMVKALNCPCGSKHNKSIIDKEPKQAVECGCGTELSASKTKYPPKQQKLNTAHKETMPLKQSRSFNTATDCSCWNEKLNSTSAAKRPAKEQASQCPCKEEPCMNRKKVPFKQSMTKKNAIDCSYWNEMLKSTSAAKPPAKEQASLCPCKEEPCISKKKVPLKQSMTKKNAIDCRCWNEKQTITTAVKPLSKEQVSQCACKEEPSATKEMGPLKQSVSFRRAIDCGCGTKSKMVKALNCPCGTTHNTFTIDMEPKKAVECGYGTEPSATKVKYPSKQQKPNTAYKETKPLKKSASYKKSVECGCGTKTQPIATDTLPTNKTQSKTTKQPLSQQINGIQGQSPPHGTALNCKCWTENPLSPAGIQTQSLSSQQENGPVFGIASNCPCGITNQYSITDRQPPSQSYGIPADCACEKQQQIAADNKIPNTLKTSFTEQVPSQQPKLSQTQTHTSKKQSKWFGIAPDCVCGTQTYEKKSPYTKETSLAEYPSSQQTKSLVKKLPAFGIAIDCACDNTTEEKSINTHKTGSVEYPTTQTIKSSQKHSQTTQEQPLALGVVSDHQPSETTKKTMNTNETGLAEYRRGQHTHIRIPMLGMAADCACQTNDPNTTDKKTLNTDNTGLGENRRSQQIKVSQKMPPEFGIARDCSCGAATEKKGRSGFSQKEAPVLKFDSDRQPTKINKGNSGEQQPSHQIKSSQLPSNTQKQSSAFEPQPITAEKKGLAEHHLNKQKSKSSKIPPITSKKQSNMLGHPRELDLLKHPPSQDEKSLQTRSENPQKRSTIKIASNKQPSTTHKKSQQTRKTDLEQCPKHGVKASQSKVSFQKYIKCSCKHESSITWCKKRAIDCICRTKKPMDREIPHSHRPRSVDKALRKGISSAQQVKNPQKQLRSSKKSSISQKRSSFNRFPECAKMKKTKTKLSRRASVYSKSSKNLSSLNKKSSQNSMQKSLIHSECNCPVERLKVPAGKTSHLSRKPAQADKPRPHSENQRPEASRHKDYKMTRHSSTRSNSVDQLSSKQAPSKVSRDSSKISRLVMKLRSKLFSRKISKQTKLPHHEPSPTDCPCPVSNNSLKINSKSRYNIIQKSTTSQCLSISSRLRHTNCRCLVDKKSSKVNREKTSFHTCKSILVDKSHPSLSQHSQVSKKSHHPGLPANYSHSISQSTRRGPILKTSSKLFSDKISNTRKPSLVGKSHSCLSRRSISWQTETSQRSCFSSYSSEIECRCLIHNTSSLQLSKISQHQFHSGLSQSQQSKTPQHSSILMSIIPVECTCSSETTSLTPIDEKSHSSFKTPLEKKSHSRSHPLQSHKMSQLPSPMKLDSQRVLGQQTILTQPTSKISSENYRLSSEPTSHLRRKTTIDHGSQYYSSKEPLISKRSSFLHRPQSKPLIDQLRFITDKISLHSRKKSQEKISNSLIVQTSPIIPGKCSCFSNKLHQLSDKISQYSRKSVLEKIPTSGTPHLHSYKPTPSVAKDRLISDPVSQQSRKLTLGTQAEAGYPQHLSNQKHKITRNFGSQPTPSTPEQLPIDPPHKTSIGTEIPPVSSQQIPSHRPEISKQSRHYDFEHTPTTEKQMRPPDPVLPVPRITTAGTDGPHPIQHLPSQQPEITKQSRHYISQQSPTTEEQPLLSDSVFPTPHITSTGTERPREFSQQIPSQKPEISKQSRHYSSEQTSTTDKQMFPSEPIPLVPSLTTIGNERPPAFQHLPSQQPVMSKQPRHYISQKSPTTEEQPLLSDSVFPTPNRTSTGTERPREFSQQIPSQKPEISKQSRHYSSEHTPTTDKQMFAPDPVPLVPRLTTIGNERPPALQHIPSQQPVISKQPRHYISQQPPTIEHQALPSDPPNRTSIGTERPLEFPQRYHSPQPEIPKQPSLYHHTQPKQLTGKLGNLSDTTSQQPIQTKQGKLAQKNWSEPYPNQQYVMPKDPYPLDPSHPIIPIIPGMCTCAAKNRLKSQQYIDLQHHPNHQPVIPEQRNPLHNVSIPSTDEQQHISHNQHLPSQQPEMIKYSPHLRSQPTPAVVKQRLVSDRMSHLRKTTLEPETKEGIPHHVSSQHPHLISEPMPPDQRQHQSRLPQQLRSQQPDIIQYSPLSSAQPITSGKKQRLIFDPKSHAPRKNTMGTEKSPVFKQLLSSHKRSVAKHQLVSDPESHPLYKITAQPETTKEFPEHFSSHRYLISQPIPSNLEQHPHTDSVWHPRKTKHETIGQSRLPCQLSTHQPEISKLSHRPNSQPTPLAEKQSLTSDPVPQVQRRTTIGTEVKPRILQQHLSQQPEIIQCLPPLHNFQPTSVIPGKCTCSASKYGNQPNEVPNHLPNQSHEMSHRPPSSQNVQQSHVISGVYNGFVKKIRLSRVNVSDYTNKIDLAEKPLGTSQHVIIQRSEISQNPQNLQNPQIPQNPLSLPSSGIPLKIMSALKRNVCECPATQPQISPDKISHVSRKTAPVEKPPPGLLQRRSSVQVREGSADSGVQQQQFPQPAIPQQVPYPDFNRVSMRYPGHISARRRSEHIPQPIRSGQIPGPMRSGQIPGPIRSEHIPHPANYYYPPAVGVSPPPNYARYPCYINPANRCGPRSCSDEFALRRAYKRRPLRYIPPKQQLPKQPKISEKQQKQGKKVVDGKKKVKGRSGSKFNQYCQCVRELVYEAEKEAWPTDVTCRPMYIHTLKRRPCFWIFECCPSMYPAFLGCFKFQETICQMFMYVISLCFWCPLMFCLYLCCDLLCQSG